ncbi:TAXI family TRAP transporter solute-binding subunit [Acetomicrobium hydrogeniformans]|uniref:TAXI family TRAP transporter solute-binding subunit n=1 Tax=Acetomicrobium hydrogeniformans TaxID=649746 RepID=UPI0030B82C1A
MALVVGLVFSVGTAQAKTFVSIATGGTGGTYYPIGGGIADVVSRYAEDIQATAETGNAAVANLNLLGTHSIEFAFVQNDTAWWAARGEIMFKNAFPNIRAIATLYPETNHLVVMKKANIKKHLRPEGQEGLRGSPWFGN